MFCHGAVNWQAVGEGGTQPAKSERSSELAFAAPSCTLPGTSPNQANLLVERQKSLASALAGDRGARGLNANHSIFKRAEAADTSLVQGNRNCRREVGN